MLGVERRHLDDFTLLCHVAGEFGDETQGAVEEHLRRCSTCRATLANLKRLHQELLVLAKDEKARQDWYPEELPAEDSFARRPNGTTKRAGQNRRLTVEQLTHVNMVSERAVAASLTMLGAIKKPAQDLTEILPRLCFSDLFDRFTVLYALQEAGREIAENPAHFLAFAEGLIAIPDGSISQEENQRRSDAEQIVPTALLRAQASQLAGQARLWTGDLEKAGADFRNAYRGFGAVGDEAGTARVEQLEAQRRFFTGRGSEALILARRAGLTFAMLGLEDEQARCRGAEGMALFQLGRWQESADAFREALRVFETYQLWSNYVGTLNSIATAMVKIGRLDEARREYARALRRLSREQHRSWLPFIRKGLAEVLFSAGRYREAAVQAARAVRLYDESGQVSRALVASLFEIESWARAGDLTRARHRLELFRAEIIRQGALDATLAELIEQALSGASPDFQELISLREHAAATLKERVGV